MEFIRNSVKDYEHFALWYSWPSILQAAKAPFSPSAPRPFITNKSFKGCFFYDDNV